MPANPLLLDPTRTITLRRAFLSDFRTRIRVVKTALVKAIVTDDVFGLSNTRPFTLNTSSEDVTKLRDLTKKEVEKTVEETKPEGPWFVRWLKRAYTKGMDTIYRQAKKGKMSGEASSRAVETAQEVGNAQRREASQNTFAKIVTRTAEAVKTLGQAIVNTVVRIASSFNGSKKEDLAKQVVQGVDTTLIKAKQITNSEVVGAHADGQLDMAAYLGMGTVTTVVEFTTTGGANVCKRCQRLSGKEYKLDEARGIIPVHPNCMCSFQVKPLAEK